VGGIAPLGAILNGKGAKKTKGAIGGETTQRGQKCTTTIQIIELTSVACCHDLSVSWNF